jgi:hypothetical protein
MLFCIQNSAQEKVNIGGGNHTGEPRIINDRNAEWQVCPDGAAVSNIARFDLLFALIPFWI